MHDALIKPLPGNNMAACLAESWRESEDGLTYEFQLREGLTFHNGDPFTAEDVQFSFLRYKGTSAKLLHERVKAVEVIDAHRVRFVLHAPWPDFLTFYATPATGAAWIVPKKYQERVGEDGFKRHPVGLGPYRFERFDPGVELVIEANEHYWWKTPSIKQTNHLQGSAGAPDPPGDAEDGGGGHRVPDDRGRSDCRQRGPEAAARVGHAAGSLVLGVPRAMGCQIPLA